MIHYVTSVTFNRVSVFRSERACEIFLKTLKETRERFPYKLIGYVIMPDHAHVIVNTLDDSISEWLRRVRGYSARETLSWLRNENHLRSLAKLALSKQQKRNHTHAIWQKDPSVIDLWSEKFMRQKLNYVHMNPVRAGLCDHPAKWKWSSYHAYLPHEPGDVPIEIDWRPYWTEEELKESAKRKNEKAEEKKKAAGRPPLNGGRDLS